MLYSTLSATDYQKTHKDTHDNVLDGFPCQLTYQGRTVAWLVSWWQLNAILKTVNAVVHPEVFSASKLLVRWLEVKELLNRFDVILAYKTKRQNAFAVVSPRLFFCIRQSLPPPTPRSENLMATLSQLHHSPKQFFRPAAKGSVVLVTEHGRQVGCLLSAAKLAKFQGSRRDPVASGRARQQVGLYLDLMEAGQGDVQPITVAGKEVLALVPMRVWRRLSRF
ncbi:MAG: hypothetical protein EBZ77_14095 [Chitinophagia bacterium]|nr:hypothetical protein [Chitinophagia bacterium]